MKVCVSCKKHFEISKTNQHFCNDCFRKQLNSDKLQNRNDHKKMLKNTELQAIFQTKEMKKATKITQQPTSKLPMKCPHNDCNKYISLSNFIHHFQYDHKDVSIVSTDFEARNSIIFYPTDVRYGVKQCIVLLDLFNCNNNQLEDLKPAFLLATSRVSTAQLTSTEDQRTEQDNCNGDKVIIWVSSNIATNFNYTVVASNENIKIKFFGPVYLIGQDEPSQLSTEGNCMILSYFQFMGMSEAGLKPIKVDVVIHED